MQNQISIAELQSAVSAAVAKIKLDTGPLIIGFVAPDKFSETESARISKQVADAVGQAHGTPTVGKLATTAITQERAKTIAPGHIIIGLVIDVQ